MSRIPYRFLFYASDGDEPIHIHVRLDDNMSKFWIKPVRLAVNIGFPPKELREIEKLVERTKQKSKGNGMNSLALVEREAAASSVVVTDDELIVSLVDGCRISATLVWYPRLSHATQKERKTFELIGRGAGIHWPLVDEDLSVSGILRGNPSYESDKSLQGWLEVRGSIQSR